MVRGVILAGGASVRMGRPKAGLTVEHDADTFVARLIYTMIAAQLPDIVVVTGAVDEPVRRAAGRVPRSVRFAWNCEWQSGQLSSLLVGLAVAPTALVEAAVVTLVDVPFVAADTVCRIVSAWRGSRPPIVRPAQGDRHGHPVLFDRAMFPALRAADRAMGAKAVVRAHQHEVLNLPIADPGAYLDIDTEDDYRRVLADRAVRRSGGQ